MKKRNYTLTTALTAALCCLICLLNGCTRDNDIDIPQTSVNTMGATTVQPGETITLTGDNMHLISKVYFGDVTTLDIKHRRQIVTINHSRFTYLRKCSKRQKLFPLLYFTTPFIVSLCVRN